MNTLTKIAKSQVTMYVYLTIVLVYSTTRSSSCHTPTWIYVVSAVVFVAAAAYLIRAVLALRAIQREIRNDRQED